MPQVTNHYLHDNWPTLYLCQLKRREIEQNDHIQQTFDPHPTIGERAQVPKTPLVEREQVPNTPLVERESKFPKLHWLEGANSQNPTLFHS